MNSHAASYFSAIKNLLAPVATMEATINHGAEKRQMTAVSCPFILMYLRRQKKH